jgi:hypothetical protein
MPANRRRSAATAPYDRWELLGRLLETRRRVLGHTWRTTFERDRGVNTRLAAEIEKAAKDRVNHFMPGTLQLVAEGYQVTYESVLALLRGERDDLVPAAPAAPAPVVPLFPDEPPGWLADEPGRSAANRPYMERIRGRLDVLRLQGVTAPSGAQLFGEGTPDAREWDKYSADWETRDVVWFVADLQRRAAAREAGPEENSHGA